MKKLLSGSITALITPFKNGHIDYTAFQKFIDWQITQGTSGIVPCGTTGEAPTLSDDEYDRLFRAAVEASAGRVPVIAGCGSNNTSHAVHLTQMAQKAGANAALHVTPYYNKPTQTGLFEHFKAIHNETDLPIILYNIPGRSIVNISIDTQAALAKMPRIVGVKDATGDVTRPVRTSLTCPADFVQLTGEDAIVLPFLAQGGDGVISVTSNIAPGLCAALHKAWISGDVAKAQEINTQLLPLHDAMFAETSPAPVKYAASLMGLCENELRLPMVPASAALQVTIKAEIARLGL